MNNRIDIDRKFKINAISRSSGRVYSNENSVLFLAIDRAFPAALLAYKEECIRLGSDPDQIKSIELLYARVVKFQADHPHEVKLPSVDRSTESYLFDPVQ